MNKKHRKNRILTVRIGEAPTQERRSHDGGVRAEIVDRDISNKILMKRYRAVWECPLDAYLDRAAISPPEHRAGQKFRRAYFRAVFGIRVEDVGAGNTGDYEMSMLTPIYSQRILKQAYEALSLKQKEIVVNVCGHDEVAGSTAKVRTLHRALERLTDLWGQDIADSAEWR